MTGFLDIGALPARVYWEGASVLAKDVHGRALMHLRDDIPNIAAPGQWAPFGGAVEPGEIPLDAAFREFFEETGILLDRGQLEPFARINSAHHDNGLLYLFACTVPIDAARIQLAEGAGFGFLTAKQIVEFPLAENFLEVMKVFLSKNS